MKGGTAPFIARPIRRVIAGAVDLWACFFIVIFLWGVTLGRLGVTPSYLELALDNKMALITYAAYQAIFLWLLRGATPGLLFTATRVVRASDGTGLSIVQIIIRSAFRPLFLLIFLWAGTFAAPQSEIATALVVAPLVAEMGIMFTLPSRQTLADLVARTLVVNVPDPQPHRAPAAPMYSPTDAEFGVRPPRTK